MLNVEESVNVESLYKAGDVVLIGKLETHTPYQMYNTDGIVSVYKEGMVQDKIVTITEVLSYEGEATGYLIDEGSNTVAYADEMIVGKVTPVGDTSILEIGELLLVTSDDTTGINPDLLGEIVMFDGFAKQKGVEGQGMYGCLDIEDEIIKIIDLNGDTYALGYEYIEGAIINPIEKIDSLMSEIAGYVKEMKEEYTGDDFEEDLNEIVFWFTMSQLIDEGQPITEAIENANAFVKMFNEYLDMHEDCDVDCEDCSLEEILAEILEGEKCAWKTHAWETEAKELLEELEEEEEEVKEITVDLNVGTHVIETGTTGVCTVPYNIHIEKVVYQNPATIVFYRTGAYDEKGNFYVPEDSKLRKCVAKAQNDDVYDAKKGFMICIYKIFNRESARRLKELSK